MKSFTPTGRAKSTSHGSIRGFTLIELMVAIAILAILLGLAAPDLRSFIINIRLTAQINELVADITLARNEAATRGAPVTMCPSVDLETCAGDSDEWKSGRIVFVDASLTGTREATEQILKRTEGTGGSRTLDPSGFPDATFLSFRPFGGMQSATGGSFKLCDPAIDSGRTVTVEFTGRPIASKVTCP